MAYGKMNLVVTPEVLASRIVIVLVNDDPVTGRNWS